MGVRSLVAVVITAPVVFGALGSGGHASAREASFSCTTLTHAKRQSQELSTANGNALGAAVTTRYSIGNGATVGTLQLPKGWSPLTSTRAQLAEVGFPQRPRSQAGLKAWMKQYKNFKGTDPTSDTQPLCRGVRKFGEIGTKGGSGYNYAGLEETHNAYLGAYGNIGVPAPNELACGGSSTEAWWVGTTNNSTIDQGGTGFDPTNDTGFQFWGELYPLSPYYYNNGNDVSFHTGNQLNLEEQYQGSGKFEIKAYDHTTGYVYYINFTGESSKYVSQNAEFVNETQPYLYARKYSTVYWNSNWSCALNSVR